LSPFHYHVQRAAWAHLVAKFRADHLEMDVCAACAPRPFWQDPPTMRQVTIVLTLIAAATTCHTDASGDWQITAGRQGGAVLIVQVAQNCATQVPDLTANATTSKF
jgi:hypothetical protein